MMGILTDRTGVDNEKWACQEYNNICTLSWQSLFKRQN